MDQSTLIAVLMGGPGSEREVSLASGVAVLQAFLEMGFNAISVDVTSSENILLPQGTGLAFNVIHGTFGEDGALQEILEKLGVPYTGAGVVSSRLAFDKILAKEKFLDAGVPTPRHEIIDISAGMKYPRMPLPYVIKPPREGSSVGVHIVRTADQATAAIEAASQFSSDILVEQLISGKELTVGILNGEALPIVHIAPRSGFYDIKNKYPWMSGGDGSDYFCPADLDTETTKHVQTAAVRAHKSLGIEVYSRVDVLLDETNQPFVLEANTIPGMTQTSLLPKAASAAGIPFKDLCLRIADISLNLRT